MRHITKKADTFLPCPFCGSWDIEPDGVSYYKDGKEENGLCHDPACNNCGATSNNWNVRAYPSEVYWNAFINRVRRMALDINEPRGKDGAIPSDPFCQGFRTACGQLVSEINGLKQPEKSDD